MAEIYYRQDYFAEEKRPFSANYLDPNAQDLTYRALSATRITILKFARDSVQKWMRIAMNQCSNRRGQGLIRAFRDRIQ
jgi:hypothetical protein